MKCVAGCVMGIALAASVTFAQSVSITRGPFPIERGAFWDYTGLVATPVPGSVSLQQRAVTLRMEITDVIERGYWMTAAVLKGHPRDLTSFKPDTPLGDYALVNVHQKSYLLQGERAQAVLRRLRDTTDSLSGLVRENEVVLDSPMFVGQRFCDTAMLTRTDELDCWHIDSALTPSVPRMPGVPLGWDGPEYELTYRTQSSIETVGFGQGVGVTSYEYSRLADQSYIQLKLTALGRRETR